MNPSLPSGSAQLGRSLPKKKLPLPPQPPMPAAVAGSGLSSGNIAAPEKKSLLKRAVQGAISTPARAFGNAKALASIVSDNGKAKRASNMTNLIRSVRAAEGAPDRDPAPTDAFKKRSLLKSAKEDYMRKQKGEPRLYGSATRPFIP